MYKRGTPEYDRWRKSPEYALYCKQISVVLIGRSLSEEHKRKISAAQLGKRHSAATRAKIAATKSGERHPMYGKHHSAETRAKQSVANSGEKNPMYGKHHNAKALAKISAAKTGKHHNAATRVKISTSMTGERNPNWQGGSSFEPYPINWTKHLRETIRKRDNYICALCGKGQNGRKYPVHHIDYDKKNLCPENLITLCTGCHIKTNYDREYWTNLFEMIYVPNFPKRRMKNESCC